MFIEKLLSQTFYDQLSLSPNTCKYSERVRADHKMGPGSYYVWVSACKCKGPYTSPYTENLFVIRDSFVFHSMPYNQTATALARISMPMNDFQSEDLSL